MGSEWAGHRLGAPCREQSLAHHSWQQLENDPCVMLVAWTASLLGAVSEYLKTLQSKSTHLWLAIPEFLAWLTPRWFLQQPFLNGNLLLLRKLDGRKGPAKASGNSVRTKVKSCTKPFAWRQAGGSTAEKDLGVPVGSRLNSSQQQTPTATQACSTEGSSYSQ